MNALRAFEAAARHLSFTEAARELNVTQGAISRQVKTLEDYFGLPLFERLTRALRLTEYGQEYLPVVRDAFDRLEGGTLKLLRQRHGGVLTVSVLPTLAIRWLIPRLAAFHQANPAIEVRMITSIQPANFHRDDIDVAIRVGALDPLPSDEAKPGIDLVMINDWTGVRAAFLMPDVLVPVCSPALVRGHPPLRHPDDLRNHVLLHTATRPRAWPDWLRAMGITDIELKPEPAYGHFFMTLQAASEGHGVAIVPKVLIAGDLASESLVVPFPAAVQSAGAYYVLCREHQWDMPKVRAFRDWLLAESAGARDDLPGDAARARR